MKWNFKFILAAAAAFAMVLSCSKVEEPEIIPNGGSDLLGQTTISATLSDALTKVAFTPSYDTDGKPSQLALAWEADDKLRVYDSADKTKFEDFTLDPVYVGQKTGSFTGNLFSAESYYVEVINGDLEYAVQTQPADGVTTSLKYLARASAVTDLKAVEFTEYSSVLAITAKMPEGAAAGVASVELSASEAIFSTGKTLTINLDQKGDAGDDGILNLFATLPVGDQQIAEGTTLLVTFNAPDTDHTVYTRFVELGSQTFTAGKLNTININATQSDKHAGVTSCDGSSAEKAYLIGDKYQMQAMNSLMTADATTFFKMVDDVDLAGINWTPLNGTSPYTNAIDFDGANHKILNLTTDGSKRNSSFAAVLIGKLSNVTFDKAAITGTDSYTGVVASYLGYNETEGNCSNVTVSNSNVNSAAIAGGFAANGNYVGKVEGCSVTNTTVETTAARVGGFIGSLTYFREISDSYAENITVESSSYAVGGFIGEQNGSGTISDCHTTGTVQAGKSSKNYTFGGGFIGQLTTGTLTNCYSTCDVSSEGMQAGGLIGLMKAGTVSGCYASGSVTPSNNHVGGLIGAMESGEVTGCYSDISIIGNFSYLGGLVGTVNGGKVSKSYATGDITASAHYTGGLIGQTTTGNVEISQCYATGTLSPGQNRKGGIVGNVSSGTTTVTNCYTTCPITCKSYSGCLIGGVESVAELNMTNSYSKAEISGHVDAACVFTGLAAGTISCTGVIGWNISNVNNWSYNVTSAVAPTGNYMGTEGTISDKAKEFGWDETIWDLSGEEPRLRP